MTRRTRRISRIRRFVTLMTAWFALLWGAALFLGHAHAAGSDYYISAAGSDSNNGTSKTTPWLHAPGMPTFTGSYTPSPGDQWFFRGGDTWHYGNSGASPYVGGTWSLANSGTPTAQNYIGVDTTWFNASACGATWCRPILDDDNPPSTSFVSSCTYARSTDLVLINASYVTFDNFEMRGVCWSSTAGNIAGMWDIPGGTNTNIIFSHNYCHGWTMPSTASDNFPCVITFGGGTLADFWQFAHNVFDGFDSPHFAIGDTTNCQYIGFTTNGCASGQAINGSHSYDVHGNVFRYLGNAIVTGNCHTVHDNLWEYIYNTYSGVANPQHPNLMNCLGGATGDPLYVYNNVIRHTYINEDFYFPVRTTATFSGNVMYDNMNSVFGNLAPVCIRWNAVSNSAATQTVAITGNTGDVSCGFTFAKANSPLTAFNGSATFANNHFLGYSLTGADTCAGASCPQLANVYSIDSGVSASITDNGNEVFQGGQSQCTASGTTLTNHSGAPFVTGSSWVGQTIYVPTVPSSPGNAGNFAPYTIASVTSTTSLQTTTSMGSFSSGAECAQYISANAQGYTAADSYAPTNVSGATVGAGANLSTQIASYTPDLFGSFAYGTSQGAAEMSLYGGQAAIYPAIYQTPRPSVWDAGAYQFAATNAYNYGSAAVDLYCGSVGCTPSWGTSDGPATLPTYAMYTNPAATPSPGSVVSVGASNADLTSALASPVCGTTLQLTAGFSYSGNFTIPVCTGTPSQSNWVTITTSGLSSLPAYGTRINPCYSGVTSLQGRPPFACPATPGTYTAQISTPNSSAALTFSAGASFYRVVGIEVTRAVGTGLVTQLINIGNVGNISNIIFDRTWLHGDEDAAGELLDETEAAFYTTAVNSIAFIDGYGNDFGCISVTGACSDSKVFGGGLNTANSSTESGVKAVNDLLEAAGENYLYGGGTSNTVPTNFEFRLNTFFKPRQWNSIDPASMIGNPPIVKNLGEFKNGTLALFEANTYHGVWGGFSQNGSAILLTPKNQANGVLNECPICAVTHITHRYETVNTSCEALQIAMAPNGNGAFAAAENHLSLHDIVADNQQYATGDCSSPNLSTQLWSDASIGPAQVIQYVALNHITIVNAGGTTPTATLGIAGPAVGTGQSMSNITYANNVGVAGAGTANADSTNCASSPIAPGVNMINNCWSFYAFGGNAFVTNGSVSWPGTNNTSPANQTAIYTAWNNGNAGNYLLTSGSWKNSATDGSDPGANLTTLASVLAGNPVLVSGGPIRLIGISPGNGVQFVP